MCKKQVCLFQLYLGRASPGLLTDERGGGQKGSPPYNLSHISYNNETYHSYTLTNEDLKRFLLTSAFFHRKLATFVISRNADIDCTFNT